MTTDRPVRRRLLWAGTVVLTVLVIIAIGPGGSSGPPLDPTSTGPAGTRGILDVLRELGVEVAIDRGVPATTDTVALVIVDEMDDEQRDSLLDWVQEGGRLVLADPLSEASPGIDGVTSIAFTEPTIEADCDDAAVAGVDRVTVVDAFVFGLPEGATGCFPRNDGFWMVRQPLGSGEQVSLGGAFTMTNDQLDEADNAVFLVNLLTPADGGALRVVRGPRLGGGREGLGEVLPDQVGLALAQIPLIWLAMVWWRGRRDGRPPDDSPPVRIDAAETTLAVGNLLQRAGRATEAAHAIRQHLTRQVHRRLGVEETLNGDPLVAIVAERTGTAPDVWRRALVDPLPVDDDGLTRFANSAARLQHDLRTGEASTAPPAPATRSPTP